MAWATSGNFLAQAVGQAAQRGHIHAAMRQFQIRNGRRRRLAPVQRIAHAADQQTVVNGR